MSSKETKASMQKYAKKSEPYKALQEQYKAELAAERKAAQNQRRQAQPRQTEHDLSSLPTWQKAVSLTLILGGAAVVATSLLLHPSENNSPAREADNSFSTLLSKGHPTHVFKGTLSLPERTFATSHFKTDQNTWIAGRDITKVHNIAVDTKGTLSITDALIVTSPNPNRRSSMSQIYTALIDVTLADQQNVSHFIYLPVTQQGSYEKIQHVDVTKGITTTKGFYPTLMINQTKASL